MAFKMDVVADNLTTGAGPQTFEISGFGTPKAAMVFICRSDSTSPHASVGSHSIGFTTGISNNTCCAVLDENTVTGNTDAWRVHSDRRCGWVYTASGSEDVTVDFNAWTGNGVTFDFTGTAADDWNIVIVLFGATKLPQLGRGIGEGIKNFRRGVKSDDDDDDGA